MLPHRPTEHPLILAPGRERTEAENSRKFPVESLDRYPLRGNP
jgi:hypothetical protein